MQAKGKRGKKLVVGVALATILLGSGSAFASYVAVAGPQANGTGVTPHGWTLTPAGKQITLGNFPMGAAISPDQRYLVVSNDGDGAQSLQVVDTQNQKVVQTIPYKSPASLYLGVAFSPDGKTVYASGGGDNQIHVYGFTGGTLTEQAPISMKDQNNTKFNPAGLSVSPDGQYLFVANNLNDSISRIDLSMKKISITTSVGKNPYAALLSRDGSTLYVSNWGESSVTVLDPTTLTVKKTITVGLHPNAMTENPVNGLIYIANSDADQVSVIDPTRGEVIQSISLAPYRDAPPGSTPDALTVSSDGATLYVANAGNDDVAVIQLDNHGDRNEAKVKGLIPTAWYPTGVYLSGDGKKLLVLNEKGLGAGPNTQGQDIADMINGSLSFIDTPTAQQLKSYTKQVEDNNTVYNPDGFGRLPRLEGVNDFPIPRFADQSSPIKHVIYVVKENRTYDQIFGDMGKGNGDKTLTTFGQNITPNLHKLANQFALFDNFYADSEVSTDGHKWTDQGEANDFIEKNWPATNSGRRSSVDILLDGSQAPAGNIWNDAARSHVTFRNYGEGQTYNATTGQWVPRDPKVGNNYDPEYAGWSFNVSDMTRYAAWEKEFRQFETNGNLPQLEVLYLPNDHTAGTSPNYPTPQAMVAQNDLAVGKIVDTVSHSEYWKDTAIFITEDDAQDGMDHVDAHRTESLVISPYTQTGKVDSTSYDTASMLRTMELVLGLKPMTQFDASAIPMLNAFTNHPSFAPFSAVQPQYALAQKNGLNAPDAQVSAKMDWSTPDANDDQKLNRIIWKATKGNEPYPGDK